MAMNWREARGLLRLKIVPANGELLVLDFVSWCWDNDVELPEKDEVIFRRFLNFRQHLEAKVSKSYRIAKSLKPFFKEEVAFGDSPDEADYWLNLCQGWNDCLISAIIQSEIPKRMSLSYRYRRGRTEGWNQAVRELRDSHQRLFQ